MLFPCFLIEFNSRIDPALQQGKSGLIYKQKIKRLVDIMHLFEGILCLLKISTFSQYDSYSDRCEAVILVQRYDFQEILHCPLEIIFQSFLAGECRLVVLISHGQ